jgi:hypothetical protein
MGLYQIVYDITKTLPPNQVLLPWLGGLVIGIVIMISTIISNRSRSYKIFGLIFSGFWLTLWLCFGGLGFGNVFYQYYKCVDWAKSGDYSIITGNVAEFDPMPYGGHKMESFSVNEVHFEYSDYDLSQCGFNNTASHGGPIKEGLPVRISYKDGRILILEIKNQNSP